ncbi:hypothetical protein [Jatrophihabitans endophyticus]|uniref:hypothetical protein n=1 Tax=Jatrophihabitans endophyticus TaxID=1206085 RepID=UPI001A0CB765|nr:hypothetical protein [Jatrophihabitans endophyticus]MBE7187505.1 hypothetical protein [Jatrophihabitans endophyticus]
MNGFSGGSPGSELLVGEIRGLRTFRVDESGRLLPLYSDGCWYDGPNTAVCSPPTGDRRASHAVPADDCECGFYAYGSVEAAGRARAARYVQAVVSCWGGVVAGTQGLRAEYARIDAIWLGAQAPPWLRQRVAGRYPSARMFADKQAMTAEYPLTDLHCYRAADPTPWLSRSAAGVVLALVLALGLAPAGALHAHHALWISWLAVTCACAATVLCLLGTRSTGHLSAAAVAVAVLAWLVAPWLGVAGWLLRLPVLRALLVAAGGYLVALLPRHFPVEAERRDRHH